MSNDAYYVQVNYLLVITVVGCVAVLIAIFI